MRNKRLLILTLPLLLSLSACSMINGGSNKVSDSIESNESLEESSEPKKDYSAINKEIKGSYNYFKYTTNLTEGSKGYGLTQDRLTSRTMASIGATGFLLGSYPVFVEEGLMKKDDAKAIVDGTFDTILRMQNDSTTSYEGCISHFVNMDNGKRFGESEVSTVDTAILVSGCITASQYFEDEELINKANQIWGNVDYNKYITQKGGKSYISMGVDNPTDANQLSPWDYYAEQWMIYILGAGNPNTNHRITSRYYKNVTRARGEYGGIEHIYSWFGSIFTYQYSQAFFNFKDYNDYKGNNFFDNSVKASQTAYKYCQDLKDRYKTFSESSWGLTACDAPRGYSGDLGALPNGAKLGSQDYLEILGTIAPTGAISSMPFTPEESYRALEYYQSLPDLNSNSFGLRDSFNLDYKGQEWYDADMIGIDKGVAVMQMYNYKNTDFISNLAMNNPYVIEGFLNNEFTPAV